MNQLNPPSFYVPLSCCMVSAMKFMIVDANRGVRIRQCSSDSLGKLLKNPTSKDDGGYVSHRVSREYLSSMAQRRSRRVPDVP